MGVKYQTIILELNDGRLIAAHVPAFCTKLDRVKVKEIRITEPTKLPEDCKFERMS